MSKISKALARAKKNRERLMSGIDPTLDPLEAGVGSVSDASAPDMPAPDMPIADTPPPPSRSGSATPPRSLEDDLFGTVESEPDASPDAGPDAGPDDAGLDDFVAGRTQAKPDPAAPPKASPAAPPAGGPGKGAGKGPGHDNRATPDFLKVTVGQYEQPRGVSLDSSFCTLHPRMGEFTSTGKPLPLSPTPEQLRDMNERRKLLENSRIMTFLSDVSCVDYYNFLRTQVLQRTRSMGRNTIMVTSVKRHEGKSTTALNLALSISREAKQTALLVEANLRHPSLAVKLGLDDNALGLSDYLFGDIDVSELLIDPGLGTQMRVIVAGRPLVGSTDVLSLPKTQHMVQELKNRYQDRYVIFDCPHLMHMPDALVFAGYVDGIVVVVEEGRTLESEIADAISNIDSPNIVGMVLNKGRHA